MALTIQFKNKDSVLRAYESRGVEAWALFQSRQFLFKGVGQNELENVLNAISEGGTNAIYTLKVYEGVEDASNIKSKTDDDGSFNFRLNEETMELPAHTLTSYRMLDERLSRLEEQGTESDTDIEVKESSIIGELMGNPAIAAVIPVLIEKVMNLLNPKTSPAPQLPSTPSGVGGSDSFNKMKAIDKDFEKNLIKLCSIAETNPSLYNSLIQSLNGL